mmetsp:Transcript_2825/g.6447  ORF Transcript_2825/g.6447 Transcript_2825/m.6447 type:complete len:225 (+) Transcript_2825:458-1132(+)
MHLEEKPREARAIERHLHLRLRPPEGIFWAAGAEASTQKLCPQVPCAHREHEHAALPLAHLAHAHGGLDGRVGRVNLRRILLGHLPLQLLSRRAVHLCKHLHERLDVLPDGDALKPLHREHLACAEGLHQFLRALWVLAVYRERDGDLFAKVRHDVAGYLPHDGGLGRVVELVLELLLHGLEDLLYLLSHTADLHGEGHRIDVHLEIPLHVGILDLDGNLQTTL